MQQRMVFIGLFMLLLALASPLSAQNLNCQGDQILLYKATAPSGLSLREAPNQWANKLGAAAPKSPSTNPILLIEGLSNESARSIQGRSYQTKFIYPGEMTYLSLGKNQYYLYAKGVIQLNKATDNPNPFGSIRNYELRLKKVVGDQTQEETLFKMDIPAWFGQGYEGSIFLEGLGD